MARFEPPYLPYRKRVWNSTQGIWIVALVFVFIGFSVDLEKYPLYALLFLSVFLLYGTFNAIRYSKTYLKSISITDTLIEVVVVDKNRESQVWNAKTGDCRIRIVELVWPATRRGRNFKLQIDIRRNEKFETVFEQYEIGKWDIEIFNEIFEAYCRAKNIPHTANSLKRIL